MRPTRPTPRVLAPAIGAVLILLSACSPVPPPSPVASRAAVTVLPEFAQLTAAARESVVEVKVNTADGPDSSDEGSGAGSGFVIASDGVVMTAAHVVRDASRVTVRLADKREFPAKVEGVDLVTDIALLKIDASRLRPLAVGDPALLRAGDWVLAIGSPFGFDGTVTAGVVSAVQRELPGSDAVRFIQTDVPINPGSSGGPLLNARGEVVGINAQIYSLSGAYQGLAFAIPVDVALDAALQMVATGHAVHGALGAIAQGVDSDLASAFRLARPHGALLAFIEKDGAAAKAGLRIADVVLSIDGIPVATPGDLSSAVAQHRPGDHVALSVWRRGAAHEMQVMLGDGSREATPSVPPPGREDDPAGMVLDALPGQLQSAAGGVLVAQVSGRAARAGLQPGDVLLAIDDRWVDTPAAARAWLGSGPAALLVRRGDEQRFFALPPPSPL